MSTLDGVQPKDLARALGLPVPVIYSAIIKLRNQKRAQEPSTPWPPCPMENWELIAAFERHGVPQSDHRALIRFHRLGKVPSRVELKRYKACLTEIMWIICKRERK